MTHASAANLYLHMELRKITSQAASAGARVRHARTLAEVMQCTVIVPGHMRALTRSEPSLRQLAYERERRAKSLVEAHLKALSELARPADIDDAQYAQQARHYYGKLKAREWCHLRGDMALLLQQSCRQAEHVLHALETAARIAPDSLP